MAKAKTKRKTAKRKTAKPRFDIKKLAAKAADVDPRFKVERGRPEGKPTTSPCYFCSKQVAHDPNFCFGCKRVICDDCSTNPNVMGHGHDPEEHRDEPEEPEESDPDPFLFKKMQSQDCT